MLKSTRLLNLLVLKNLCLVCRGQSAYGCPCAVELEPSQQGIIALVIPTPLMPELSFSLNQREIHAMY